jgi:hypothetical protein
MTYGQLLTSADARISRVPNQDDVELSAFEHRELIGDFSVRQGEDAFSFEMGRLKNHQEWVVWAKFDISSGEPVLRSVAIYPAALKTPNLGLTTAVLRDVRIGALNRVGRGRMTLPVPYGPWFGVHPNEFHRRPRPGRSGRDDSFYARWAAEYVDLVRSWPKPLKRLAKRRNVSESQARSLLYEARRRDLLTKSRPGTAGGHLTPKAIRILRREDHGQGHQEKG